MGKTKSYLCCPINIGKKFQLRHTYLREISFIYQDSLINYLKNHFNVDNIKRSNTISFQLKTYLSLTVKIRKENC